jgi:penicillin-binding protein 2
MANGGVKHKPQLVIATQDVSTRVRTPVTPEPAQSLGYKPENIEIVRNAMVAVTQGGTSAGVFAGAGYLSAGKTGTAQAVSLSQKEKYNASRMEERQRDHSLYIAFAPAENPKIALAVIVENAGFGSTSAAPIARRVFDYWLLGQYPNADDLLAVSSGQATAPKGKPLVASTVPWPRGSTTTTSSATPMTPSSAAIITPSP